MLPDAAHGLLVQITCLCQQVQEGVAAGPRQPELQLVQDDALHAQDIVRLRGPAQHSMHSNASIVYCRSVPHNCTSIVCLNPWYCK